MYVCMCHVPQMIKKHGSLRKFSGQGIFINLYEQVHGTREIESPALPWHTIQWIHISQSLGSENSDYSNRNFLPTIQIPFRWICILSFILRCRSEKWWPASVFSPKEELLGCSHQPFPSWSTSADHFRCLKNPLGNLSESCVNTTCVLNCEKQGHEKK